MLLLLTGSIFIIERIAKVTKAIEKLEIKKIKRINNKIFNFLIDYQFEIGFKNYSLINKKPYGIPQGFVYCINREDLKFIKQ
ncbi:MAG TPA: hypothetical protein VIN72_12665 [Lutibacter sp.]